MICNCPTTSQETFNDGYNIFFVVAFALAIPCTMQNITLCHYGHPRFRFDLLSHDQITSRITPMTIEESSPLSPRPPPPHVSLLLIILPAIESMILQTSAYCTCLTDPCAIYKSLRTNYIHYSQHHINSIIQ